MSATISFDAQLGVSNVVFCPRRQRTLQEIAVAAGIPGPNATLTFKIIASTSYNIAGKPYTIRGQLYPGDAGYTAEIELHPALCSPMQTRPRYFSEITVKLVGSFTRMEKGLERMGLMNSSEQGTSFYFIDTAGITHPHVALIGKGELVQVSGAVVGLVDYKDRQHLLLRPRMLYFPQQPNILPYIAGISVAETDMLEYTSDDGAHAEETPTGGRRALAGDLDVDLTPYESDA